MKKIHSLVLVGMMICTSLCSCGESKENTNTSTGNTNTGSNSISAYTYATETDTEESTVIEEGTPVTFEDTEFQKFIAKQLGISSGVTITDKMCESITELECSKVHLTTLADLKMFPNLTKLYVDNLGYELELKGINKVTNLTSLTLKNCGLSEVDRIAELTKLEYLDISGRKNVIDYSTLSALSNLKYLDISGDGYNKFSLVDGSFINSLTNLEELNIYHVSIDKYSFVKLKNLRSLTIGNCHADNVLKQLCDSGGITSLEKFDLYDSEGSVFDDRNVYQNLTNDGIKKYLSKAVNLKFLKINHNMYNITSLEGIGNLKNLEVLYLNTNNAFQLPLSAYNELSKLTNLKKLTLEGSVTEEARVNNKTITPNDYAFLNKMTSLEVLCIEAYDSTCSLG